MNIVNLVQGAWIGDTEFGVPSEVVGVDIYLLKGLGSPRGSYDPTHSRSALEKITCTRAGLGCSKQYYCILIIEI